MLCRSLYKIALTFEKNPLGQGYSFAVTDGNFLFPRFILNGYNFTKTLLFFIKEGFMMF